MLKPPLDPSSILPWEDGFVHDYMNDPDIGASSLSLVIPIYNSGAFLEKTLRSLLLSDLRGVQIIVSDGGSNDSTHQILDHYSDLFSVVISEPDKGQSDAINKGFARATGELYGWLNGDDILLPYALNIVRNEFVSTSNTNFIVGNAFMTEKDFRPIHHFEFSTDKIKFEHLLDYASHHLIQPSVFFTRKAWEVAGELNIDDHYAMDADLFLGIAKHFEGHHINRDLAYSVYHEDCKTRGKRAESITQLALVQAKHGGFSEARKTLDILVQLFNDRQEISSNTIRVELNDIIGSRESLVTLQESCLKAMLSAELKERQ
jgi:glycosyltransferase involved in cell wall biosynthesis